MALTLPVYSNADTLNVTWDNGGGTALQALTSGGANGPIQRGLLTAIRFTYYDGDATGSNAVVVKLYKSSETDLTAGGEILGEVTLNFSAEGETQLWAPTASNGKTTLAVEIPIFQTPYIHCTPGTANSDILITPYVRSIAGSW